MPVLDPAYAKPPRDLQRAAVDRTFDEMVRDARQSKGSVFDTMTDKMLRQGTSDPHMGLSPQGLAGGIVANPEHKLFQQLLYRNPKFAGGLQKVPEITEYLTKPIRTLRDAWGVTSVLPTAEARAAGLAGKVQPQRGVTQEEIARLAQRGPGASLQSYPAGRVADETLFHEGLHTLYAKKFPVTQSPKMSRDRAQKLIVRVMNRIGASDEQIMAVLRQYGDDPSHGLVDVLARYQAHKTGGTSVLR